MGDFHFYSGFFYSKLKKANQPIFEMCFLKHYLMDGSSRGIQLYLSPPLNKHLNYCHTWVLIVNREWLSEEEEDQYCSELQRDRKLSSHWKSLKTQPSPTLCKGLIGRNGCEDSSLLWVFWLLEYLRNWTTAAATLNSMCNVLWVVLFSEWIIFISRWQIWVFLTSLLCMDLSVKAAFWSPTNNHQDGTSGFQKVSLPARGTDLSAPWYGHVIPGYPKKAKVRH